MAHLFSPESFTYVTLASTEINQQTSVLFQSQHNKSSEQSSPNIMLQHVPLIFCVIPVPTNTHRMEKRGNKTKRDKTKHL